MRSIWGGDGSSVFVWGLTQPGSDLYGVPLRIYGKKSPRRSCFKEMSFEEGHGITGAGKALQDFIQGLPTMATSISERCVTWASCREMSLFLLHPSSRVPTGKQNEFLSYFGNWMLVDWMNPAHPCSLSSGRRAKGTSRSHLLVDHFLGRETRLACSLGVSCWYNFHGASWCEGGTGSSKL